MGRFGCGVVPFRDELGTAVGQGPAGGGPSSRLVRPPDQAVAMWSPHSDKQRPGASGPFGPECALPGGPAPPAAGLSSALPGARPAGRQPASAGKPASASGAGVPGAAPFTGPRPRAGRSPGGGGRRGAPPLWASVSPPRKRPHEAGNLHPSRGLGAGEAQRPRNKLLTVGIWFQFPLIFVSFSSSGNSWGPGDAATM